MGRLQYIYNTSTYTYFEDEFNITLSNDSEIEMKFRVLNYNSVWDGRLFICGSPYHDGYAQFQRYSQIRCGFQSFGEKYTTVQDPSAIHIVNVSKNGYYVDGESLGTLSGSASVQGTGFGINATKDMELEIYYITVKENGVMAHNYVGWEGNGVVGLKDMVTNVFYTPTSGSYTAGPAVVETPVIPINKYKFYNSNVQKTYEGSTEINKMYVGSDLVYNKVVIPPNITYVDYIYTTENEYLTSFIDTGIYPTVNTKFRVKWKSIADDGGAFIGFGPSGSSPQTSSSDNNDYRVFFNTVTNNSTKVFFDFNAGRIIATVSKPQDGLFDITFGNMYMYNNVTQSTITTGSTQHSVSTQNVPMFIHINGNYEQVQQVTIYEETNGTDVVLFDGYAAELNGVYGLYDTVSQTLLQPTDGSTVYGGTWQ